tara:strand:+ start:1593 stop:2495 length:903 start_codon:yes stop_codon:yes gene_type:complete
MVKKFKKIIIYILLAPSKALIHLVFSYERIMQLILPQMTKKFRNDFINLIDKDIEDVNYEGACQRVKFKVHTPNDICSFRQQTFSTKEPEILEWIEKYGGDGTFYDVGANIGIYSLYYAMINKGNVYSFEPSVFNLRQLAKNISINNLEDRIKIISNPLSQFTGFAHFINSNSDEGGALSAFGVEYGYDGKPIESKIKYSLLGFSMDELLKNGFIEDPPSLIKIDVDGIEHLILSGAQETLKSNICKSVFIEVNNEFKKQSIEVKKILESSGFILHEKRHSEMIEGSNKFGSTYNQIWIK